MEPNKLRVIILLIILIIFAILLISLLSIILEDFMNYNSQINLTHIINIINNDI